MATALQFQGNILLDLVSWLFQPQHGKCTAVFCGNDVNAGAAKQRYTDWPCKVSSVTGLTLVSFPHASGKLPTS